MVRDILIDIDEKDILFSNKRDETKISFKTFWGNIFESDKTTEYLICNILIPKAYWKDIKCDEDFTFICNFRSSYTPK